jgi:hypothetical protein
MPLIINTRGKLVEVHYTAQERLILALKAIANDVERKTGMTVIKKKKK